MKRIKREITREQYIDVTENHNCSDIFTSQELMGYGVYCDRYFQDKETGKYYVEYSIGDSCD